MFRQHVPDGKPKSANTNKQRVPTQYPISQPVTVTPIQVPSPCLALAQNCISATLGLSATTSKDIYHTKNIGLTYAVCLVTIY